ncbi:MAG: DNA polymerase III subunit beta [Victivallaceae bacterium]|nr:DNA polymerase III subunit beta [Victivallaceae bacterium]
MNVKINREKLGKALQKVVGIIGNRPVFPILSNVLFEAENGIVKLTATDLELRVSATIDAEVTEPGRTTIPAKKLASLVSCMTGAEVTISLGANNHVAISCGSGHFKVYGIAPDDFPSVEDIQSEHQVSIPESRIKKMISCIQYAVSADDSRKALTGVLFSVKDNELTLVTTDGKRMAIKSDIPSEVVGGETDKVVPFRSISELRRLADGDELMKIIFSDNQCIFSGNGFELRSKLIEKNYPDYRRILPVDFTYEINFPSDLLKNRIQIVSCLLTQGFINLNFADNKLTVSGASSEFGEGDDSIDIEYSGEPFCISFNPQYIMDPLQYVGGSMKFKINDPYASVVIEGDDRFLYLVMPIRKKTDAEGTKSI